MPMLSSSNLQQYLDRFSKVTPDAKPLWGKMTGAQMFGHVTSTLRYTLNETPLVPFRGTFVHQYIFAPLALNGIVKFPRNVKIPRAPNAPQQAPTDGDFGTLKATIERVLQEAAAGSYKPPHHPYFGNIGPTRWLKFHAAHFDHHLRQFGV